MRRDKANGKFNLVSQVPEIRPLPRFDQFQTNMENRTPKHTQTHSNQLISQAHIVTEHKPKKKNHKKIILNTLILLLKFHILLQKLKPLRAKGNAKKNRSGKMRLNSENLRFDDAVFCLARAPIIIILHEKKPPGSHICVQTYTDTDSRHLTHSPSATHSLFWPVIKNIVTIDNKFHTHLIYH